MSKSLKDQSEVNLRKDSWLFLGSGVFPGHYNMARDRELLSGVQSGSIDRPVLRFYRWKKPTVSLGVNQSADACVNRAVLEQLGYGLEGRPTGGRALLHKGDLCYAVIANRNWHPYFTSLSSTYRAIGQTIRTLLQSLGIVPDMIPSEPEKVKGGLNPCFAMISPFEVTVRGRKISGSAQFRSGEWFLQHGSIRIRDTWDSADLELLWPEGLSLDSKRITSIDEQRGQMTSFDLVASEFRVAFADIFQVSTIESKT